MRVERVHGSDDRPVDAARTKPSASQGASVACTTSTTSLSADLVALLESCVSSRRSIYLFGADVATIYRLRDVIGTAFPTLSVAGICDRADGAAVVSRAILSHILSANPAVLVTDLRTKDFATFQATCGRQLRGIIAVNMPVGFTRRTAGRAGLEAAGTWLPQAMRRRIGTAIEELMGHLAFSGHVIRQWGNGRPPARASCPGSLSRAGARP